MKKSKEEIRDWLLKNCVNEKGMLDLIGLDFSGSKVDVDISHMKVKGSLFQDCQRVQGDLYQQYQKVKGDLYQCYQKVAGNLWQIIKK